jgi:hypothetical protein
MNGKGFIVICLRQPVGAGHGTFHFKEHPTLEAATAEAGRLARLSPGDIFAVYEAVRHARLEDPLRVTDPRDDGLPF